MNLIINLETGNKEISDIGLDLFLRTEKETLRVACSRAGITQYIARLQYKQ